MDDSELSVFDDVASVLRQARESFRKKDNIEAYRTMQKARLKFCKAEDHVLCSLYATRAHVGELTEEDKRTLASLNALLADRERQIKGEYNRIAEQCRQRIALSEELFLKDYEMEIKLSFFVHEDHPAYSDERDNIVAGLKLSDVDQFDNGVNYAHRGYNYLGGSRKREYHCFLFHALYDHVDPSLSWHDMLQIGRIYVDINVRYESWIEFEGNKKPGQGLPGQEEV